MLGYRRRDARSDLRRLWRARRRASRFRPVGAAAALAFAHRRGRVTMFEMLPDLIELAWAGMLGTVGAIGEAVRSAASSLDTSLSSAPRGQSPITGPGSFPPLGTGGPNGPGGPGSPGGPDGPDGPGGPA